MIISHPDQNRCALTIYRSFQQYWAKDQTRAYIAANWEQWEAEPQEEWFADPVWKHNLPEWAWPDAEKREAFFRTIKTTKSGRVLL